MTPSPEGKTLHHEGGLCFHSINKVSSVYLVGGVCVCFLFLFVVWLFLSFSVVRQRVGCVLDECGGAYCHTFPPQTRPIPNVTTSHKYRPHVP